MLIIRAEIHVAESELRRTGATTDQLLDGIQARLSPVVSCHPDEIVSSKVDVTLQARSGND